jgi:hypothetical protein
MEPKDYLNEKGFRELLNNIHHELTRKQPLENTCFDAWYFNNEAFFVALRCLSKELACKFQNDLKYDWTKEISPEINDILDRHKLSPKNWGDYPEGQLSAIAIILSGWVTNQLAIKARDRPNGREKKILEDFKLFVNAAMEVGEEYTKDK